MTFNLTGAERKTPPMPKRPGWKVVRGELFINLRWQKTVKDLWNYQWVAVVDVDAKPIDPTAGTIQPMLYTHESSCCEVQPECWLVSYLYCFRCPKCGHTQVSTSYNAALKKWNKRFFRDHAL